VDATRDSGMNLIKNVPSKRNGTPNNIKSLKARKTNGINRIAKISYNYLCISYNNKNIM
jgi:hypothetical protein